MSCVRIAVQEDSATSVRPRDVQLADQAVHTGGAPSSDEVKMWITAATDPLVEEISLLKKRLVKLEVWSYTDWMQFAFFLSSVNSFYITLYSPWGPHRLSSISIAQVCVLNIS
jgi:hypothetical protein